MNTKRRGFMTMDVILGMVIVTSLMVLLTVAVQKQRQASVELATHRSAGRQLEAVMSTIRFGDPANAQPPQTISIEQLPEPAPTEGHVWVRLSTRAGRAEVNLMGLVPKDRAAVLQAGETSRP